MADPDPSDLTIRPAGADEMAAFFTVLFGAFGSDPDDEAIAADMIVAEPERTLAVFDRRDVVATAGAFTFDLAVPGGRAPTAGVTCVGVRATHRRRGLLNRLMRRQLTDVKERGEPIAALWASEAAIYGRYGYGVASQLLRVEIDRVDASLRRDLPGTDEVDVRLTDPADCVGDIEAVEQALSGRPGTFARDKRWIDVLVQDPKAWRRGRSTLQCLVAHTGGEPVGYALYRTKARSTPHDLPDGEVTVQAQAAVTPAAEIALTRILLGIDLMRRVSWGNRPVDTPLPHLLTDPRQARTTVLDGLHVRVVDVPAALTARRYATPVDVVIDVDDPLLPDNSGRWHLRGDDTTASCERTGATGELRLPIESLGAIYLGGISLLTLAAAGRVESASGDALRRTAAAFGSSTAPWCPVVF